MARARHVRRGAAAAVARAGARDKPWPGLRAEAIVGTVGQWRKIAERAGAGLPAGEGRTPKEAIDGLLELSRSQDSRERQLACRNLCTCHVRADDDRIWARLLELVADPDQRVRGDVLHAITDSTPAPRVPAVIAALQSRHDDPDPGIRRQARKILAHYRRTGKVTDGAR
jgi:HEAT repeat protein